MTRNALATALASGSRIEKRPPHSITISVSPILAIKPAGGSAILPIPFQLIGMHAFNEFPGQLDVLIAVLRRGFDVRVFVKLVVGRHDDNVGRFRKGLRKLQGPDVGLASTAGYRTIGVSCAPRILQPAIIITRRYREKLVTHPCRLSSINRDLPGSLPVGFR